MRNNLGNADQHAPSRGAAGDVPPVKERLSIKDKLGKQVEAEAERSSCERLNVGAIIHDSRGVILSSGYNGTLAGMAHCDHTCNCDPDEEWVGAERQKLLHEVGCRFNSPCTQTVHAEANAILWAARRGVATEGHSLITTHSPCYQCACLIIQAGIVAVRCLANYRDPAGLMLLQQAGIAVECE